MGYLFKWGVTHYPFPFVDMYSHFHIIYFFKMKKLNFINFLFFYLLLFALHNNYFLYIAQILSYFLDYIKNINLNN